MDLIDDEFERFIFSQDQAEIPDALKRLFIKTTADLVIHPKTAEEVREAFDIASDRRLPVIPRGAGSSGFGGIVPTQGGMVLDLSQMNRVLDVDLRKMKVSVEAGVRWADLDRVLKKEGCGLKSYPSSFFSTVGGWASTGGCGINSYKFGHMRDHILAIQVITPSGEIRELQGEEMTPFIGTEGQMGVITKIELTVRERPNTSYPYLLYFESKEDAIRILKTIVKSGIDCVHMSYFNHVKMGHLKDGFEAKDSILLHLENGDEAERLEKAIGNTKARKAPEYLARYLWNERFFPMKSKGKVGAILASEVIMPLNEILSYIDEVEDIGERSDVDISIDVPLINRDEVILLSHFSSEKSRGLTYLMHMSLVLLLTRLGIEYGGRPYGIGIWNTPFIDSDRITDHIKFKGKTDPENLLNPGKFFGLETKYLGLLGRMMKSASSGRMYKLIESYGPIFSKVLTNEEKPKKNGVLEETAGACLKCGSCAAVCPAYLISGDESLTPRGKLYLAREYARGKRFKEKTLEKVFLCSHCKLCEEVCQGNLNLLDAFELLEEMIRKKHGWDPESINDFVEKLENDENYQKRLDRYVSEIESAEIKNV